MPRPITVFWHRRDLRIEDNAGLAAATESEFPVLPLFIFDRNILDKLSDQKDARVSFIHQEIARIKKEYQQSGSDLLVRYGHPAEIWKRLIEEFDVREVWMNRDYEPYAQERDREIKDILDGANIPMKGRKDHVIFEKSEVTKDDGDPYSVYTPYSRKWKARLEDHPEAIATCSPKSNRWLTDIEFDPISLEEMGFEPTEIEFPPRSVEDELLQKYGDRRDLPAVRGTSRLSVHLRFGTVSIRSLVRQGMQNSEKWLNELIWRDFYQMILFHYPKSADHAFKAKYEDIPWRNNEEEFAAWCEGRTGYPMVDAGMRELNTTGFMHNRVRMVVASFLTKHLLIHWKWGERYFAEKLLDYELASNVGGWQWAASTGCDAAPYFRVFNPESQFKKFDPEAKYVRKWVPEYQDPGSYPAPIVDHKMARQRAIDTFKEALAAKS